MKSHTGPFQSHSRCVGPPETWDSLMKWNNLGSGFFSTWACKSGLNGRLTAGCQQNEQVAIGLMCSGGRAAPRLLHLPLPSLVLSFLLDKQPSEKLPDIGDAAGRGFLSRWPPSSPKQ